MALWACGPARSGPAAPAVSGPGEASASASSLAALPPASSAPFAMGPAGSGCDRFRAGLRALLMPYLRASEALSTQKEEPSSTAVLRRLCVEDGQGAWALALRGLASSAGEGDGLRGQQALVRLDLQGREVARSRWLDFQTLSPHRDWFSTIELEGDGVPEVLVGELALLPGSSGLVDTRQRLFRLHEGAVGDVPGTEALWLVDLEPHDRTGDGRVDLEFRGDFSVPRALGMTGRTFFVCSSEIPGEIARGMPDGSFSATDAEAVRASLGQGCDDSPLPEGSPASDRNLSLARRVRCLLLAKKREQAVAMAARCKRSPEDTCGYCDAIQRWLALRK